MSNRLTDRAENLRRKFFHHFLHPLFLSPKRNRKKDTELEAFIIYFILYNIVIRPILAKFVSCAATWYHSRCIHLIILGIFKHGPILMVFSNK